MVCRVSPAAVLVALVLLAGRAPDARAAVTHHWPADGSPADAVGGVDGVLTADPAYAPGLVGQGFRFAGSDSATFAIADNPGTGDFSVAFAIQTTQTALSFPVSKRPVCDSSQAFWNISYEPSNDAVGVESYGAGAPPRNVGANAVLNDGLFHTVVYVRSGTTVSLYIDGGPAVSATYPDASNLVNGSPLTISANPCLGQGGSTGFVGVIDELRYANSAEPELLAPPIPLVINPPAIPPAGDPGATITCPEGTWRYNPTSFTRQWLRDGDPISGATGATYTLTGADAGHAISCRVTAANLRGSADSTSATLAVSVPPVTAPPPDRPAGLQPTTPGPVPVASPPSRVSIQSIATLPSAKACFSRRRFPIRLRGVNASKIVRAQVKLNGKQVRNVTGKALGLPIDLRGLPKGRFTVEIVTTNAAGKRIVGKRTYRTCVPKGR